MKMKILLILLLCFLLTPIKVANGAESEQLPKAIRSILDKRFPGWRFSEVSSDVQQFFRERFPDARPNLIRGDFDGDGRMDYAMLIEHSNFNRRGAAFSNVVEQLAFLKRGVGYKLYFLDEYAPSNPELYLNLARKGEVGHDFKTERKFRYPNDSISISYFEKAGGTYIYRKGRFQYVIESD